MILEEMEYEFRILMKDKTPQIFELNPAGDMFEFDAFAIGAKSQSAKTYLEKNLDSFVEQDINGLVLEGLKAIKSGYKDEKEEMSGKNVEVYTLSPEEGLVKAEEEVIQLLIDSMAEAEPEDNRIVEETA